MATHRPAVPSDTKRILIDQAGRKCSNPGCPNRLVELHHIREWHIYQTHDAEHMIAICSSCHDAVDRGHLQISDEELYRWKGIDRRSALATAHIFVEPGDAPGLLLGSLVAKGESGLVVFDFAEHHQLSFAVRDGDIILLNVKISDPTGNPLLDVVDGYIRQRSPSVELHTRPGAITVPSGGILSPFVPEWVRRSQLREDRFYAGFPLPLLALRVIDQGLVHVQGLWLDNDRGVAITPGRLSFLSRGRAKPFTMLGAGEATILNFVGPLNAPAFNMN
jgi:hypothetical protein